MDLGDLGTGVLFLLPGFLAATIKNFLTPTRRISDFERLVESILLSGFAFLIAYVAAYAPMYILSKAILDIPPQSMRTGDGLFISLVWLIAVLIGLEWPRVMRSDVFIQAVKKNFDVHYNPEPSFWAELLKFPSSGRYHGGWVRVYLEDGKRYIGAVTRFTTDPNEPEKELVLEKVYGVDEKGLPQGRPLPIKVYIPASRIIAIHVLPHPSEVAVGDTAAIPGKPLSGIDASDRKQIVKS